jgi:hypothetical protein
MENVNLFWENAAENSECVAYEGRALSRAE